MASSDKTEQPTHKRRSDALEKGQVPRSKEVSSALVFLAVLGYLSWNATHLIDSALNVFLLFWQGHLFSELSLPLLRHFEWLFVESVTNLAAPVLILIFLASIAGRLVQGNVVLTGEPLKPKLDSLNPINNVKKVFSTRGLMELAKALALILVLGGLTIDVMLGSIGVWLPLSAVPLSQSLPAVGELLSDVCWRIGLVLLVVAAADFGFQKYKHEQDLKQTRQEVKDDHKQTEGDPLVKQRIRRQQREIARRRMISEVQHADVVITNPTHYAVALKYEPMQMSAPRVVAKGRGLMAQRIREIAGDNGVPLVENVQLARALYKAVEIDAEVPEELYQGVAKILAYVYRLKQERMN